MKHIQYLLLNVGLLMATLLWPVVSTAAVGQAWATNNAWELIVLGIIVLIPCGAWLGVLIPPPDGFSTDGWTKTAKFISGLVTGYTTAMIVGNNMDPLAITLIPPSIFAAIAGPALLILIRKLTLIQFGEGK